jgi:hypothetical protein
VRHAGREALSALGGLLAEIRKREGLVERSPGVFYRKGRAFLHFHEDPRGLHADIRADIRPGAAWERFRVETKTERQALLSRLGKALSDG